MRVEFTKMHGIGNDFVVIDGFNAPFPPLSPAQVAQICDRHFGIGADGVIVIEPGRTPGAAGFMNYFNADGSPAQMCGNGTRVAAKWLVEHGKVDCASGEFVLDTLSGTRSVVFTPAVDGKPFSATVGMGKPVLDPVKVPAIGSANTVAPESTPAAGTNFLSNLNIATPWGDVLVTCVSIGSPHAVWFLDDWRDVPAALFDSSEVEGRNLAKMDISRIGKFLEASHSFPQKANIEFVVPSLDGKELEMRVFRRGVGEVLASGSGACAAGVAAALTGRGLLDVTAHLPGGDLRVQWRDDNHIYLSGTATQSFTGSIELLA